MKKTILNLIATAALAFSGTIAYAGAGDIWDIAPCKETGEIIVPQYSATNALAASETMYFKLRFLAPDNEYADTANRWDWHWMGVTPWDPLQYMMPRIGIFVSGKLTWAEFCGYGTTMAGNGLSDFIFKYTVQAGDFALPITLAVDSVNGAVSTAEADVGSSVYYLDGSRYSKTGNLSGWRLRFPLDGGDYVDATWCQAAPASSRTYNKKPTGSIEKENYWNLYQTTLGWGFYARTIDFAGEWHTNNVVWRSVHQNSVNCEPKVPQLEALTAPDQLTTLYVWVLDENVAYMKGENVRTVTMPDPANPSGTKTFQVAAITFQQGQLVSKPGDFQIFGKDRTAGAVGHEGETKLILSAYDHFTIRPASADINDDYVTVPIRCIDPLPPTAKVDADFSSCEATSAYMTAANYLTVSLSEPITSGSVTMKLKPYFSSDGFVSDEDSLSICSNYVRFGTSTTVTSMPDAEFPEIKLTAENPSVYLSVFCLRGDDKTYGVNQLKFMLDLVSQDSVPAIANFGSAGITVVPQNPVITKPVSGAFVNAIQFEPTPVEIRVTDTFADLASTNGYEIYVKYNPADSTYEEGALQAGFTKLDGWFKPGNGGVLERVDDGSRALPAFTYTRTGEYETLIYVKAPVSKNCSCGTEQEFLKVNSIVTKAKGISIATASGRTEFNEGEKDSINIALSAETTENVYAYLQITTEDVKPEQFSSSQYCILGLTNKYGKCKGLAINRGYTNAVPALVTFLDGYGPASGDYLMCNFQVVLSYDSEIDGTNITRKVSGYDSDNFMITVKNVEPTIKYMEIGGFGSDDIGNNGEYSLKLPKGQDQTLNAEIKDPSDYDKKTDFKARWVIYTSSTRDGTYQKRTEINVTGDANCATNYNFNYKGWNKVVLQVKDKDMDEWAEASYTTYIEVLSNPTINVVPSSEVISENDNHGRVTVSLSYFDSEDPLYVKLTVKPVSDSGDPKVDGELLLDQAFTNAPAGTSYPTAENVYYLTFESTDPQDIMISRMDGTLSSSISGFYIQAEVVNPENNPKTGDAWCDYYTKNLTTRVYPQNVAPNYGKEEQSFSPAANPTNAWTKAQNLKWTVFNDVYGDLQNPDNGGLKVTINVFGTEIVTNVFSGCGGVFDPSPYMSSLGANVEGEVTITIEDKDGDAISRTWKFKGEDAKFLYVMANGPGATSSSDFSQKYAAQSGRGKGHTWVDGQTFVAESGFRQTWNCQQSASALVYAWGYKVAKPYDNGWLDMQGSKKRDCAIDDSGAGKTAATTAAEVTGFYNYTDYEPELDSFFYGWVMTQSGADGNDTIKLTLAPERPLGSAQAGKIVLPAKSDNASNGDGGASFADTEAEALFSKEYLATDNMGDINYDGIPDLYFVKYFKDAAGSGEGEETISYADLVNYGVSDNNNPDGDFLPGELSHAVTVFTTNLAEGVAFKAVWEIRGFGEALNDATRIAGISDVKPDVVYLNPDPDAADYCPTSTLSKVEYAAWLKFAATKGIVDEADLLNRANWYVGGDVKGSLIWSPERPTDPTVADTDDDGLPDGLEYYYWYRAHVGYFDEKGVHRQLTGRRFDPRNPGQGKLITSEQIAELFDPLVGNAIDLLNRDTDNDGLSDYEECVLGTNPFDFDTDGDGLPDGYEILAGMNPWVGGDNALNNDGDAMAYATLFEQSKPYGVTCSEYDLAKAEKRSVLSLRYSTTFAVLDPDGDSDGVQWYATTPSTEKDFNAPIEFREETAGMGSIIYKFKVNEQKYFSTVGPKLLADGVTLAAPLGRATTFCDISEDDAAVVQGLPVDLPASTVFDAPVDTATEYTQYVLDTELPAAWCNTAWIYGHDKIAVSNYVSDVYAVGRPKALEGKDQILVAVPSTIRPVAFLHSHVYQQFGFDPRTAWSANETTYERWAQKASSDGATEVLDGTGKVFGMSARTRAFTAYDEFLVLSYFLNSGAISAAEVAAPTVQAWANMVKSFTTNPLGPEDELRGNVINPQAGEMTGFEWNLTGADTDEDGVPDGWELYVMSGPKDAKKKEFAIAGPYSAMSPVNPVEEAGVLANAKSKAQTDSDVSGDKDGLTEWQEFAGTDSVAYYAEVQPGRQLPYSTTISRPEEHKKWFNKFFPTDPWNGDTDGDGLGDSQEMGRFNYVADDYVDTKKYICIPGGGLNPCSVDTDCDGLPDGWEVQFAPPSPKLAENPEDGYVNGMDGTVFDSYSVACNTTVIRSGLPPQHGLINRDYDRDGLENWQEYMTGAMRAWRYDVPTTVAPLQPLQAEEYYDYFFGAWIFNLDKAMLRHGFDDSSDPEQLNKFWNGLLLDPTSGFYNPGIVANGGDSGAQFFSRCENPWDPNYGLYYQFYNKVGGQDIAGGDLWGYKDAMMPKNAPSQYSCCSPIKDDTDQDGMDDYYELFHGMNPLLGVSGALPKSNGPCDIVADAWKVNDVPIITAQQNLNVGVASASDYDFRQWPWFSGEATADPDGDDIRNQEEAIMPKLGTGTWHHTDPTPLWMTDASYADSYVRRFFRMPTRDGFYSVSLDGDDFVVEGEGSTNIVRFADFQEYIDPAPPRPPMLGSFSPDQWYLAADGLDNWMFSFEQNEGFDSDHDGVGDYEELQGLVRAATDPIDVDSPRRRQAMYFGGPDDPSALQTPPQVSEVYPVSPRGYATDVDLLLYTVECWAKPESADDATILERAFWTGFSHPGDEELLRRNFQLAIRDGRWYTAFDTRGTLAKSCVEAVGRQDVEVGKWTHLAATFDGHDLILYVNGVESSRTPTNLQPEYGATALALYGTGAADGNPYGFWFKPSYTYSAYLIGASFKTGQGKYDTLDLMNSPGGFSKYEKFFKGYVDEVRIWDGARSADVIKSEMVKRYTSQDAADNRAEFYSEWKNGKRRYNKDANGDDVVMVPELRHHWAFDSVPGAVDKDSVATAPHGFDSLNNKPVYGNPVDYEINWWKNIVDAYGSVYAGELNWVTWIPDTVAHLPRFDGTTWDSMYQSDTFMGEEKGNYYFHHTAEPGSFWTQLSYNGRLVPGEYQTTGMRDHLITEYDLGTGTLVLIDQDATNSTDTASVRTNELKATSLSMEFEFTGRNRNSLGDDLLPLGGAFAKYCDEMWDDNGPSAVWENTGSDADGDGLPGWWEEYARQHTIPTMAPGDELTWNTVITYKNPNGDIVTGLAGELYLTDVNKYGVYLKNGTPVFDDPTYIQIADVDGDGMLDWWEELFGINGLIAEERYDDPDNDGLSNQNEYRVSYGDYPYGEVNGFPMISPKNNHSLDGQVVPDYFLPGPVDGIAGLIGANEYIGEILTDHDFMEDWWERKNNLDFSTSAKYDPWQDADEDGWSNFAEARYSMFSRTILAYKDRHTVGDTEVLDAPIPTVRVRVRYAGDQVIPEGAVLRVNTFTDKVLAKADAEFSAVPGTTSTEREFFLGAWEDRIVRGNLGPGYINLGSLDMRFAQLPQSDLYSWSDADGTLHVSRPYSEFKAALLKDPNITQNVQSFTWVGLAGVAGYSDKAVTVTVDADQKGTINIYGEQVGTIDLISGDFTFDLGAVNKLSPNYSFRSSKRDAWGYKEGVFKLIYTTTVPSSESRNLTLALTSPDRGNIREGANTIEAYYDFDGNGILDANEPYAVAKNVKIGWHQTDEIVLDLSEESPIMVRTLVAAAGASDEGGSAQGQKAKAEEDGSESNQVAEVESIYTKVRIVRESINGITEANGAKLKERVLRTKELVAGNRAYLTEADVFTSSAPDLDWRYLNMDAAKLGIGEINNATYRIDRIHEYVDGSWTNETVSTFTRQFSGSRPVATAVEPVDEAPVYSAAPTFRFDFDKDDGATAFEIQVRNEAGEIIYDSGIKPLIGRSGDEVNSSVVAFTAPIYVDSAVTTNGAPVLYDGSNYAWRVALFNAKYNVIDDAAHNYCGWTPFQMDVANANRNPGAETGYGRADAVVRYYGPARFPANVSGNVDISGLVVVEAFASADFSGQALAQTRLDGINDIDSLSDVTTVNVMLKGVRPGTVYLRAFIDLNNNGSWDRFEPWGYANHVLSMNRADIYTPAGLEVESNPANDKRPPVAVIFIEDTDYDRNDIVDCREVENFAEDSPSAENDDYDDEESDPDYYNEGDVMAYAVKQYYCVLLGAPDYKDGDETETVVLTNVYMETTADKLDTIVKIPAGTLASELKTAFSTYKYGNGDAQATGIGRALTAAELGDRIVVGGGLRDIVLVHDQVYREFGFNPNTANGTIPEEEWVNSKPFTTGDKMFVNDYLKEVGYVAEETQWAGKKLSTRGTDTDHDGIDDGWELYVMFGPAGATGMDGSAMHSPWDRSDRNLDADGDGLTLLHEYNGGYYPTDPWSGTTRGNAFGDASVRKWNLRGPNMFTRDDDNDQLSNYVEFMVSSVGGFRNVEAGRMFTEGEQYGGHQLVPDYYLPQGKMYLGEMFTDHDMIEDWFEREHDGYDAFAYDSHLDSDHDGWDNWSEARAYIAAGTVDVETVSTNGQEVVTNVATVSAYGGSPMPTGKIRIVYNGAQDVSNIVVTAYRYVSGKLDLENRRDAEWNLQWIGSDAVYTLAKPSSGALAGGLNALFVFGDVNGDGLWTPGEPCGYVSRVVVGYATIPDCEVLLSDVSESLMRINILEACNGNDFLAQAALNDRGSNGTKGYYANRKVNVPAFRNPSEGNAKVRVRIIRTAVNDNYRSLYVPVESRTYYVGETIAFDGYVSRADLGNFTEFNLLAAGQLDLDWSSNEDTSELFTLGYNLGVGRNGLGSVTYAILVGNDDYNPTTLIRDADANAVDDGSASFDTSVNVLATLFVNRFEYGLPGTQTPAVPQGVENVGASSCPVFTWTHSNGLNKNYPACRLRVYRRNTNALVYDTGSIPAPPKDVHGVYRFEAPIYVGAVSPTGVQIEAGDYYYTVSMLDAKFRTPNNSETACNFSLFDPSAGSGLSKYASIPVAVKYTGPGAVASAGNANRIVVEAYRSPDFYGKPVAVCNVMNTEGLAAVDRVSMNAILRGVDADGRYYVRAYLDTNGNGIRDIWESWGYGNYVGTDHKDVYTPRAYDVAGAVAEGMVPECVVYIEDCDTNNNKLPDVWEWNRDGMLGGNSTAAVTGIDSSYVVTINGDNLVKTSVFCAVEPGTVNLPYYSALTKFVNGGEISAPSLALAMAGIDLAQLETEPQVRVSSFSLTDGITFEVDPKATLDGNLVPTAVNVRVSLTVTVEYTTSLGGEWQVGGSETQLFEVNAGTTTYSSDAINQAVTDIIAAHPEGCFFRARAEISSQLNQ